MSYRVRLSDEARRQLLEIDVWWTTNRPGAPHLLWEEFERAVSLLETMPLAGKPYRRVDSVSFRRVLLRRSHFHLYYLVDETQQVVMIVAIWNAKRGHGPPLD